MVFLARGMEDDHYWVVEEIDGVLVETPWRIEHETDGYRLSHADNMKETDNVSALGPHPTPDAALDSLRAWTAR
jgi:hypothetical protein